jgi:hypothetical protein
VEIERMVCGILENFMEMGDIITLRENKVKKKQGIKSALL